jgi:hypothetical protein
MSDFALGDYVQVDERIAEFRAKYPEGSLQPANLAEPYKIEYVNNGAAFIVYAAAAYRTADDPRPGIGLAWEPLPGKTPYTRNSELMNAETSAWGRAIIAVLAADAKRGIATAEEVRNRQAEREVEPETSKRQTGESYADVEKQHCTDAQIKAVKAIASKVKVNDEQLHAGIKRDYSKEHVNDLTKTEASELIDKLKKLEKTMAEKLEEATGGTVAG